MRRAGVFALGLAMVFTTVGATVAAPAGTSQTRPRAHFLTAVSGEVTTDTTWTAAGSPYRVTGQFWVRGDATLTVEPGVVVEFDREGELLVEGSLISRGTPEERVLFDGTDATPGSWYGIVLLGRSGQPGTIRLENTTVAHAAGRDGAQLKIGYGTLDAINSEIRDGGNGGVLVDNGALTLRRTSVVNNQGPAVQLMRLSAEAPAADPVFDHSTITGNAVNAVVLTSGHVMVDTTWENPGAPYRLDGQMFVDAPATLTIERGVEVRSTENGQFVIGGSLQAVGTPEEPIRLVGDTSVAAAWRGIELRGTGGIDAEATFRHVTISNTGIGVLPAIDVFNGRLTFSDGQIGGIAGDGVRFSGGTVAGFIDGSALTDIGGAGVSNATETLIVAPNNWWGSAAGPIVESGCGSGDGTRIEGAIRVNPWLSSGDDRPDPLIPAEIPTLTLVPQRWFAPADGQTRVWVDAYLKEAHGKPIPGATVVVNTTLGSVTSSGITDASGHTLAYLTSTQTGDAQISASLSNTDPCRLPDATVATITFNDAGDGLLAGMQAPYLFDGISIDPEPITAGTPTTLSARITNPNDAPIRVEASFGFVQSSIGLAFGPLGETQTKDIPAKGEQTFAITWTPSISGHYCVEVHYRVVDGPGAVAPPAFAAVGDHPLPPVPVLYQNDGVGGGGGGGTGGGRGQRNLQVYPGPGGSGSRDSHPILQKAANAIDWVSKLGKGPAKLPKAGAKKLTGWQLDKAAQIAGALQGDPPRLDYNLIAQPEHRPLPNEVRSPDVSEERWAAETALNQALAEAVAVGDAAVVSLDRYGGAGNANELDWASVQMSSVIHYRKLFGAALIDVAAKLEALIAVLQRENPAGLYVTADDIRLGQEQLAAVGFAPDEVEIARGLGMSDADIETARQETLATPPDALAGDVIAKLRDAANAMEEAGTALAEPVNFVSEPGREAYYPSQLAAGFFAPAAEQDNLARVYDHTSTVVVGNPLDHAATVDVRIRPISVPAAWIVDVSPKALDLAPGEQQTVTVRITPTTPVAQGISAQVAVEGYAEGSLLGGVVVAVLVPKYMPFDSTGGSESLPFIVAVLAVALVVLVLTIGGLVVYRRRQRRRAGALSSG